MQYLSRVTTQNTKQPGYPSLLCQLRVSPCSTLTPLCLCVFQENSGLVVPWIIGFITFMALEAVAMVYSNVLRDHVNRVRAFSRSLCPERSNNYSCHECKNGFTDNYYLCEER